MVYVAAVFAVVALLALVWFAAVRRLLNRPKRIAQAVLVSPEEHTTMDANGAVRSVQAADLTLPADGARGALVADAPRAARAHLLALSVALHARSRPREVRRGRARRRACSRRPFVLLRFHAPEYEMDSRRGVVRWRIASGVLVLAGRPRR